MLCSSFSYVTPMSTITEVNTHISCCHSGFDKSEVPTALPPATSTAPACVSSPIRTCPPPPLLRDPRTSGGGLGRRRSRHVWARAASHRRGQAPEPGAPLLTKPAPLACLHMHAPHGLQSLRSARERRPRRCWHAHACTCIVTTSTEADRGQGASWARSQRERCQHQAYAGHRASCAAATSCARVRGSKPALSGHPRATSARCTTAQMQGMCGREGGRARVQARARVCPGRSCAVACVCVCVCVSETPATRPPAPISHAGSSQHKADGSPRHRQRAPQVGYPRACRRSPARRAAVERASAVRIFQTDGSASDPPPLTPLFVGLCFRAKRCVLEPKKMRQGIFSIQPGYVHLQVDIKKPAKKQIGAVLFPEETINLQFTPHTAGRPSLGTHGAVRAAFWCG